LSSHVFPKSTILVPIVLSVTTGIVPEAVKQISLVCKISAVSKVAFSFASKPV